MDGAFRGGGGGGGCLGGGRCGESVGSHPCTVFPSGESGHLGVGSNGNKTFPNELLGSDDVRVHLQVAIICDHNHLWE